MLRRVLLGLILVAGSVSLLWAAPGVVKTNDGRTITGDVREDAESGEVKIWTRGAQITLSRDQVTSINYVADIQQEYQKRLAALGPKPTVKQLMELCTWLFESREYDLALDAAERAKKLEPTNKEVNTMIDIIDHQKRLDRTKPPTNTTVKPVTPPTTRPVAAAGRNLLTPDQIQVIKRYELQDVDKDVLLRFDNQVMQRFIKYKQLNPREFMAKNQFQKAVEIFSSGLPEMHQDVKIISDPAAFNSTTGFKSLHRIVVNGCATVGCHDGKAGGNFQLALPADNDAAIYTNFYILTQYSTMVGGVKVKGINRLQPAESLILQYGLPYDKARVPHKEVPGFRPAFANDQAPTYKSLLKWINSLRAEEINYGIDYKMPTTQPK